MLILTFGHCWELLIGIILYWKVHEVIKMMEIELGGGWIFHKKTVRSLTSNFALLLLLL